MLQFIKKNKANFIWVLTFGLMGLILKPLVNLSVSYQTNIHGLREFYCFYYLLPFTLFIKILSL